MAIDCQVVGDVYECVPLEHFSKDIVFSTKGDRTYVDIPYRVYENTFVSSLHLNENAQVYRLIPELKLKKP